MIETPQEFTIITTPYWVVFAQTCVQHNYVKKIDRIKTLEHFQDFRAFYNYLMQINPKVAEHKRYFEYWAESTTDTLYCLVEAKDDIYMHPIDTRFFDDDDGLLVFWRDGDFELVQKNGHYQIAVSRYLYAEDWTQQLLTDEESKAFQQRGISYLEELAVAIRLANWRHQPVWIIKAKVNVEDKVLCPMCFDGSDFYLDYICVPADSSEEAIQKVGKKIESDYMSFLKIYSINIFDKSDYTDTTDTESIINLAETSFDRQDIRSCGVAPYLVTSFLITPYATIISKGLCDHDYWSARVDTIEHCEFFADTEACFQRLLELQKIALDDFREFNELPIDDEKIIHYRIASHKPRFEKIQRSFNVDGDIMIDWEDWYYDFYRRGDEYGLWVYLGGHADRTETFKLTDEQVNRYKQEGIDYIRDLVKQFKW